MDTWGPGVFGGSVGGAGSAFGRIPGGGVGCRFVLFVCSADWWGKICSFSQFLVSVW